MTPDQIAAMGPALARFLNAFAPCLGRRPTFHHFLTYCRGLLSDLPRKSVEPIALASDTAVRTLQFFLSDLAWEHDRLRDLIQQRVARRQDPPDQAPRPAGDPGAVGILDETGHLKKGDKTPGVQRQYCGTAGKVDNCIVTVHLAYACDDFQCLLDRDLYLPRGWNEDRQRCRAADIPDQVVYRPKWRIGLEQIERALDHGVGLDWLTFDEEYGKVPAFLFELEKMGQRYIGEVPPQALFYGPTPRHPSRGQANEPSQARHLVRHGKAFIDTRWEKVSLERKTLGPQTWWVKAARVRRVVGTGRRRRATDGEYWLIHAENRDTGESKYFVSNAPQDTPLETLMAAAFRRASIEHCFRIAKTELGMSHFEGRSYVALIRHLTLVQLLLLFLAEQTDRLRGEKSAGDDRAGGAGVAVDLPALAGASSVAATGPRQQGHLLPSTP